MRYVVPAAAILLFIAYPQRVVSDDANHESEVKLIKQLSTRFVFVQPDKQYELRVAEVREGQLIRPVLIVRNKDLSTKYIISAKSASLKILAEEKELRVVFYDSITYMDGTVAEEKDTLTRLSLPVLGKPVPTK